jgi:2-phosphosulfolactate phosphatase
MRVDVFFTPLQADELSLRDKTIVVIDVLRASTTIITALYNGAREIIPVTTVERAVKISGRLFGDVVLLGGERNGKTIQGFNLGNSPAEYTEERVRGKAIVFSTTNGSQAIEKARYAQLLMVCGFANIAAVGTALNELNRDFIVVCAGTDGNFSIEDSVCAGMLLHLVQERKDRELTLSDSAHASMLLYKAHSKNILKMVKNSEHGKYLAEIGFADDLKQCAQVDVMEIVPQLVGSVLRVMQSQDKKTIVQPTHQS